MSDRKVIHSQSNTVYRIMTLSVYKFIRHKFIFIVLMKTLEYRNRFFDYYFSVV